MLTQHKIFMYSRSVSLIKLGPIKVYRCINIQAKLSQIKIQGIKQLRLNPSC